MTLQQLEQANQIAAKIEKLREVSKRIKRAQDQLNNYKDFYWVLVGMPGSAEELNITDLPEAKQAYRDYLSRLRYVVDATIQEKIFELEQL